MKEKKKATPANMIFGDITKEQRAKVVEEIIDSSSPTKSFFLMTTVAAILCTLGIMDDNAAVIIGGMLVAPMLSPILAIAMGIGMADFKLIYRSIRVVLLAAGFSLVFSLAIALLLDNPGTDNLNHEMMLRAGNGWETLLVALVAGVAASLSMVRSELRKYLAGTAIAVALIPPLSMSAIGLRMSSFIIFYQALAQFVFNLGGIVLSSLLVFSLSRFYVSRRKATEELKEEEEMFKQDNKKNEKKEEYN